MKYYLIHIREYNGEYEYDVYYPYELEGDVDINEAVHTLLSSHYSDGVYIEDEKIYESSGGYPQWELYHIHELTYQEYKTIGKYL